MSKRANPTHPILDLVADRWSPYGYDPRPMPATDLESLFEAARWAASAFNEQPWRYLVAHREDEEKFLRAAVLPRGRQPAVGPKRLGSRHHGGEPELRPQRQTQRHRLA